MGIEDDLAGCEESDPYICILDENDVNLEQYCLLWTHLCRIMNNWGTVFSFVVKDVTGKIVKLEEMQADKPQHYSSVLKMAQFEKENETIRKKKPRSGCGQLIILNRAFEFVIDLLHNVFSEKDEAAKVSKIAQHSYDRTLSKHHSWVVQKVVWAALCTLPYREEFVASLRGNMPAENDEKFHETFDKNGREILKRVGQMIEQFELVDFHP
ncbi:unnamed protein product [Caenorhabditis auriculariae]|uniref:Glycolipid transfer protein domain-containing protein n=1 Tax=Caenorhabditis auriculariae TaxID=2777116 RepID=A0A8S1HUL0_9PELO|nr:unnamed protein product [Caenorhabditis auriculariae]